MQVKIYWIFSETFFNESIYVKDYNKIQFFNLHILGRMAAK